MFHRSLSSRTAFVLVAAALLAAGGCGGMRTAPTPSLLPPDAMGELDLPGLLMLRGDVAGVRYTPGALDRAANVQDRLERLVEDFEKWGNQPFTLGAYVVSGEDWRAAGLNRPYGMPVRVGTTWVALPAEGDPRSVALWERLLAGRLPVVEGAPMRGTPQEASVLALADLIGQRLLGEVFVERTGLAAGEPEWVRGLLAHAVAGASLVRHERQRLPELAAVYAQAESTLGGRRARPLMSPAPADLDAWLWREAQLFAGARLMVDRDGEDLVKKLLKMHRRETGGLDWATLVRRYPELADWGNQRFASG